MCGRFRRRFLLFLGLAFFRGLFLLIWRYSALKKVHETVPKIARGNGGVSIPENTFSECLLVGATMENNYFLLILFNVHSDEREERCLPD